MKVVARPSGEPYGRLRGNRGTLASLGSPSGAARRRLGLAFAIQKRLCNSASPRRGAMRAKPPLRAELCVAPRRGGVGSCLGVPPTSEIGIPIPAPDLVVPYFSQKAALACAIGRGSRSVVCSSAVDVCFAFLTDFPRGRGRRGRLTQHPSGRLRRCPSDSAYSQNRARQFRAKRVCPKSAALGFPPPAGVAP